MKKRILFVASEFASGMIPFAAKILMTLAKDKKFNVYAIVVNSGGKSFKNILSDFPQDHLISIEYPQNKVLKLLYKFYPYPIINAVNKFKKQYNPDVIHLLTGDFTLAPYFLVSQIRNKLFYYTVHDLYPHEVKSTNLFNKILHKYIVWGYKLLRDNIYNLTTSSKAQFYELKSLYPNKHISFTHFPSLLTDQIQNGKTQVIELLNEDNYILFFGTVDEYKGVDLLIKAYTNSSQFKHVKLVIAGKGLSYEELICGNSNIIRINRFIDDSEVKDLFTKATYVVYPYRSATMSGVLSLAYYFKKRVLLSSIPFFMDNATKLSFFFESMNIFDLQAKMEDLIIQNEDKNRADGCYESIYSDEVLILDYINLYK